MNRPALLASVLACCCTLLLAGCGTSPPTQFITLSSQSPANNPAGMASSGKMPPVAMGYVQLPPDLDQPALVRRMRANRLDVNGTVQWGGPLDLLVQHTLAFDLAGRLPEGAFILPGEPKPQAARLLLVTVQTFSPGPGNRVVLQAHWMLVHAQSQKTIAENDTTIHVQAKSSDAGDIAVAMSKALARFADQLAPAIRQSGAVSP